VALRRPSAGSHGKTSLGILRRLATVYSIVNTLAYNFKPIKKVFLLVEGSEKETLAVIST